MPDTSRRFDRIENDEELHGASRVFALSVERFGALPELREPWATSMMAVEDVHTARVPLSSQVQMASARARDALEAFHNLTVEEVNQSAVLRPFAHYSLIRMACEGAGLGLWLLRPEKKAKRVLRSLNLEFTHDQDARDFAATITGERRNRATPELDRVLVRLNELKDTISQLREQEMSRIPRWTDILTDISPSRGRSRGGHEVDSPLVVWKIASAFLHGSSATMRALSDLQQLSEFGPNRMASVEMRPSWRVLSASFSSCVQMLYALHSRYEYLATHDYSHRELEHSDR